VRAWKSILAPKNISKNYDFIINNQENINLRKLLSVNTEVADQVREKMLVIFSKARGLSQIQIKILDFLDLQNLINEYDFIDSLKSISTSIISNKLDYVSADQLCSLFTRFNDINLLTSLSTKQISNIKKSPYGNYLLKCAGLNNKQNYSAAYHCLTNHETHDWGCLTENQQNLDIDSCVLAKSRNQDPENADDMMWYCYSKMFDYHRLDRASCLELTHNFSILGNQLRMNWNCLNRVKDYN
jgi:hypothetical protein